jgi:hypothetical protein
MWLQKLNLVRRRRRPCAAIDAREAVSLYGLAILKADAAKELLQTMKSLVAVSNPYTVMPREATRRIATELFR